MASKALRYFAAVSAIMAGAPALAQEAGSAALDQVVGPEPDPYGEIRSDGLAHRVEHLHRQPQPGLERAAVLVVAVVGQR